MLDKEENFLYNYFGHEEPWPASDPVTYKKKEGLLPFLLL